MNWIVIILAVILVILLWYVYTIYNSTPSVASNIDLSTTTLTITGDKIKGGTSATYAIGCWLYVKNMPSSAIDIFQYVVSGAYVTQNPTETTSSNGNVIFSLNLNPISLPTLTANVATGTTGTSGKLKAVTVTTNLPIQTWVHVVVSVSSTYIDTYLNGKLVQSTPFANPFTSTSYPANNKNGPTFVSPSVGSCPVIITGLSRWNAPLDPQTVWNYYAQGNGNAMQQMLGSDYHLNVVFKKDADAHDLKIF